MKKRLSMILVLTLALAMTAILAGCACSAKQEAPAPTPETGVYQGTLVMALQEQMSVAGEEGDMAFKTTADTKYDLGDMDEIYLDDVVAVKYHVENAGKVADEVDLVEHMDPAIEFAGTLIDSDKESLTLVSKKSTVTFQMDSDTYLVGDLSQGDEIELTYLGNLNENPYANVVAVVTEADQPETVTVHGVVSEVADNTLLLGIDSAHAYRFNITGNTKVAGAANDARPGDQVDITYKGSIKNAPEALEINIVKQGQDRAYIINGKIADVAKNAVTLETDKAKYTFETNEYTKFNGDKATKGYKAEITYTGALNDKPVAGVVYCVKSDKAASKAAAKKQQSKSTSAKKDAKSSSSSSKKSSTAESKSNASTTSSGNSAKKEETAKKDNSQAVQEDEHEAAVPEEEEATEPETGVEETEEGGNEPAAEEPEPAAEETEEGGNEPDAEEPAADEPEPEADEPEPEGDEPEEGGNEPDAEEPAADEPEPEPEPEPAADEPEEADEPEAEEADEPEQAEEPAAKPDVKVSGKGTIIKGDEKKHTVQIEMKDGTKVTLTIDKDTKVASGYIPEEGDVVKVVYGSESLTLKKIQLVNRADDSKAAKDEEKAADEEPAAKDDDEAADEEE